VRDPHGGTGPVRKPTPEAGARRAEPPSDFPLTEQAKGAPTSPDPLIDPPWTLVTSVMSVVSKRPHG